MLNVDTEDVEAAVLQAEQERINRSLITRTVRQRLMRGFSATAIQPVVTAIIQLGAVPVLLHSWGPVKYGDWLILSAIPGYLSLSNLGFGDASGSDMTIKVAAGDRRGALETYQSSWALVVAATILLFLLVSVGVWWLPWHRFLHLSSLADRPASLVILALSAYVLVNQQCGVIESGFRCDGHFALGSFLGTMLHLIENTTSILVGAFTGSLLTAATTYLSIRTIGTVVYALVLRRKSPWIHLGLHYATWRTLRRLSAPAVGFMALPLAYAISIQGFTLMIASLLGPLAVTSFSTLRTLTRINFQAVTVIGWATWPELSRAFGAADIPLVRRIHRYSFMAALALSCVVGSFVYAFGPWIYRIWVHNAVRFHPLCFHILLLVTLANSVWFISSIVPMSNNSHHYITIAYVGASLLALGLARILIPLWGLPGAASALLLIDLTMLCIVLRSSLRQSEDSLKKFCEGIFNLAAKRQDLA